MIYLDSSIFLFAVLDRTQKGIKARKFLKDVLDEKTSVATSALTFDEIFWIVKKKIGYDAALLASQDLLDMQNMRIIETDEAVLRKAHEFMKKYRIDPRDAIHAASAWVHGIFTILSEDSDFDKIKELTRKGL